MRSSGIRFLFQWPRDMCARVKETATGQTTKGEDQAVDTARIDDL